jgi:hypothetical protein
LFGLSATIIFFWHCKHHYLLLASGMLPSSFGIVSAIIFIWPCKRYHGILFYQLHGYAFLGSCIIYFASLGAPLDDIIFYLAPLAILSYILPHDHASLAILFSIQPYGHAILAKYFSIWPHGCTSPGKILLFITHQGFCKQLFASCPGAHSYLVLQGFHSLALVLLLLHCHATNSLLHPF